MKNTLFAIALGLLTVSTTYAQTEQQEKPAHHQEARRRGNPEERATRQTKMMVKALGLSADQEAKLQALNLKRLNEMNALRGNKAADGAPNRHKLGKEARTIRNNWDAELKTILTPEQYATYEVQREEMRARRSKQAPANKRNGR